MTGGKKTALETLSSTPVNSLSPHSSSLDFTGKTPAPEGSWRNLTNGREERIHPVARPSAHRHQHRVHGGEEHYPVPEAERRVHRRHPGRRRPPGHPPALPQGQSRRDRLDPEQGGRRDPDR